MTNPTITEEDIKKHKELAALSYLWLFSIIILLARRDSPFIQFHARQGVVLFVLSFLLWPIGLLRYLEFVVLALMILGFMEAAMGHVYRIPVIADIAEGKFTIGHLKKGWHHTKHTAMKVVKPNHVTPAFREGLTEQQRELQQQQKLSSFDRRLEEDEKEIHKLEDEVKDLERKVDSFHEPR